MFTQRISKYTSCLHAQSLTILDPPFLLVNFEILVTSRSSPFHRLSVPSNAFCLHSLPRQSISISNKAASPAYVACVEPCLSPDQLSELKTAAVLAWFLLTKRLRGLPSLGAMLLPCTSFCPQANLAHSTLPTRSTICLYCLSRSRHHAPAA